MAPCDRVLIVDDDDDAIRSLRDVLELEGVQVATATTAAEVERILAGGFRPSAAVIDVRLREGQAGERVVRRLRDDPAFHDVGIVLVSVDPRALRRSDDADACFMKPFDVPELLEALARICAG